MPPYRTIPSNEEPIILAFESTTIVIKGSHWILNPFIINLIALFFLSVSIVLVSSIIPFTGNFCNNFLQKNNTKQTASRRTDPNVRGIPPTRWIKEHCLASLPSMPPDLPTLWTPQKSPWRTEGITLKFIVTVQGGGDVKPPVALTPWKDSPGAAEREKNCLS